VEYTRVQAIKKFFEEYTTLDSGTVLRGTPLPNTDVMRLSADERLELGDMCLVALGATLKPATR